MIRPPFPHGASLDLCARWALMLAHLYYDRNEAPVSDADYDRLTTELAECFGELSPERRFCLGDADGLAATGMGFRITHRVVGGAEAFAAEHGVVLSPYAFKRAGTTPFGAEYARISG